MTSRYFGLCDFGKVYSLYSPRFALAGALGPLIMGAGFDRTGSYSGPLVGFLPRTSTCHHSDDSRLGPYRFRPHEPNLALPKKNENRRPEVEIQTEETCR